MPKLELWYDLRRPSFTRASHGELYAAMLDQSQWADGLGFDTIDFGEHHSAEDGYLPSPIVAAAAVAGRDALVRLRMILLAPFYDPIRLAEDLAVLDLVSQGRIIPVLVGGYRPVEFALYGRTIAERRVAVEEAIDFLKKAWTGESFEYRGRRLRVLPTPFTEPRPSIVSGSTTRSIARRTAHIADGYYGGEHQLWEDYRAERIRLGGDDPGPLPPQGPDFLYVSEDPERSWQELAPYVMHSGNTYAKWRAEIGRAHNPRFAPTSSVEDLKNNPAAYQVLTPEACITLAEKLGPGGSLRFGPLYGGLEPELSWASLRLFEERVLPHIEVGRTGVSTQ